MITSRPIIILVSLFVTLIFGIFFLLPQNEELKVLQKKIREKKAELQSQEEYFTTLNQLAQELENYQIPLAKIDSGLPEDEDLPLLFDFLQKSASQSGLVLKGLNVAFLASGEAAKGIKTNQLNLVLNGSYSSLKNFLSILEKSARLIEVESVAFTSAGEEPIDFNLRIKVYSY